MNMDNDLSPPILIRQITGYKWDDAICTYDQRADHNGLVVSTHKICIDKNNNIIYDIDPNQDNIKHQVTVHKLLKCNDNVNFITITEKYYDFQEAAKIEEISNSEYISLEERSIQENDLKTNIQKVHIKSITLNKSYYFKIIIKHIISDNIPLCLIQSYIA